MIFLSLFWSAVTFVFSITMHPFMYRDGASEWGRKRAAPAVGNALAMMAVYSYLQSIRKRGNDSSDGDMQAILLGFCVVGSSVVAADFYRAIKEDWRR